jgi:hypothetical protein
MLGITDGKPGTYIVQCTIPAHTLNTGTVVVGFALTSYLKNFLKVHFFAKSAISLSITEDIFNNPDRYGYGGIIPGVIRIKLNWEQTEYQASA